MLRSRVGGVGCVCVGGAYKQAIVGSLLDRPRRLAHEKKSHSTGSCGGNTSAFTFPTQPSDGVSRGDLTRSGETKNRKIPPARAINPTIAIPRAKVRPLAKQEVLDYHAKADPTIHPWSGQGFCKIDEWPSDDVPAPLARSQIPSQDEAKKDRPRRS